MSQNNLNNFELLQCIGTGAFGRVSLVKCVGEIGRCNVDCYYALKKLRKADTIRLKQVDHVKAEREILSKVQFPFVVELLASWGDAKLLYLVMDVVLGGELFTHLRRSRRFDNQAATFYASLITLSLQYLHGLHVAHRDLKPENLLLMSNGYLKIVDFGFAKVIARGESAYTLCGTPEYLAPEMLHARGHDCGVDWWGLGILLYEMVVGQPPFADEEVVAVYQKIIAGKVYFPKFVERPTRSLVRRLLQADLSRRYGMLANGPQDVLDHQALQSFDKSLLLEFGVAASYRPTVRDESDASNFGVYPSSGEPPATVPRTEDPFLDFRS